MDLLQSAKSKLARANHHFKILEADAWRFLRHYSYSFTLDYEPESCEYVHRIHWRDAAPSAWSAVVGDVLFNARAALDHLAWAMALQNLKGAVEPFGRTAFPIFADEAEYRDARKRWSNPVQSLSAEQVAFVEQFQPYNYGGDTWQAPLWLLHHLNNIDKHRTLTMVLRAAVAFYLAPEPGSRWPWSKTRHFRILCGPVPVFHSGAEIRRYKSETGKKTREIKMEPQVLSDIVIQDVSAEPRVFRMSATLDNIVKSVAEIIAMAEQECLGGHDEPPISTSKG